MAAGRHESNALVLANGDYNGTNISSMVQRVHLSYLKDQRQKRLVQETRREFGLEFTQGGTDETRLFRIPSKQHPGRWKTRRFHAPVASLASYVEKRLQPDQRDQLRIRQADIMKEVKHAKCRKLSAHSATTKLTACQLAASCFCSGARKIVGQFVVIFIKYLRRSFLPKSRERRALKQGSVVFRFSARLPSESPANMQSWWWLCSYINLGNFLCALAHMEPLGEIDTAVVELQLCRPLRFCLPWSALGDIVLGRPSVQVSVTAFILIEHEATLDFNFKVWAVRVRPLLDTQIIWPIARVGDDALEDFHFPTVDRGGHGGDIEDEPLDMAVVLLDEIALADAAAPGPHEVKGAGKVPAKGAGKGNAKAKAKGKAGVPRATYHRDNVYHRITGELLGHIRIFAGDHQLTARCQFCGYRKTQNIELLAGAILSVMLKDGRWERSWGGCTSHVPANLGHTPSYGVYFTFRMIPERHIVVFSEISVVWICSLSRNGRCGHMRETVGLMSLSLCANEAQP